MIMVAVPEDNHRLRFLSMKGFTSEDFYAYITEDSMASDTWVWRSHVRIVLHILSAASPSNSELMDMPRSRTQYLIVDVHGSSFLDNHDMAAVPRKLTILCTDAQAAPYSSSYKLIICLQSCACQFFLEDWALETREDRVWLATVIVTDDPHWQDEWPSLQYGFGMWMKGRQLYRSGHRVESLKGAHCNAALEAYASAEGPL
ncbi:hypothetical protein EXIGLDRAFT_775350 [Exidia glandulosa HHB12029]|uniref:Uncharacterized protein n=1 Tax=Exidia glandulosa HHB12029 TaxID=1314781 RepID=A0A165DYT9_EXIGL|nr:hypothetical protein EXIGLDRAFT_775350 [Exidia glandulosa HHB12029]